MESFIEHQDACNMGRLRTEPHQPLQQQPPACLSRTTSSPSPSSETNFSTCPNWPVGLVMAKPTTTEPTFLMNPTTTIPTTTTENSPSKNNKLHPNLDLQLSTNTSNTYTIDVVAASLSPNKRDQDQNNHSTQLQLSIGSSDHIHHKNDQSNRNSSPKESSNSSEKHAGAAGMALLRVQELAKEQLRIAMAEKVYAEEARKQAKKQIELAEQELANAKRIRQQAQMELDRAYGLKEHAMKQINTTMLQITCHACKQKFQARTTTSTTTPDENSLVLSYVSSAITIEGGEVENDNGKDHHHGKTTNS